jgi:leucyl-tRNA synthetase
MFLYDIGVVPFEEPYKKRTAQGLVLGADGQKMSKSKGNTVDPIDIIEEYGADTIRTYMLFMGEYSEDSPWSDQGIKGISRFLDKVYELKNKIIDDDKYSSNLELIINKTIKKVSEDIESMKFNTAISSLMILANNYTKNESITKNDFKVLIKLLYPFAPHLTDELNEIIGNKESLDKSEWPSYEESKVSDDTFELIVQINGKVRGKITADSSISEEEMKELALNHENVKKYLEGSNIVKVITVPKKLINIVIR